MPQHSAGIGRLTAGFLLLAAACSTPDRLPTDPASAAPAFERGFPAAGARTLTVMTRNLYPGTNLDVVIGAPFEQIPLAVAQAYADLQTTDFNARVVGFVNEIERTAPDIIGLQEVTLVRIQTPGDFLAPDGSIQNPFPNATVVVTDFLQILQDELADRGLDYKLVGKVQDIDAELPMITGVVGGVPQFSDLRFTDFDVVLARTSLPVSDVASGNFTDHLTLFGFLPMLRGWVSFNTALGGTQYHVVSTHPESGSGDAAAIRLLLVEELLDNAAEVTTPTIILGDLNAEPGSPALDAFGAAGFVDAWMEARHAPTFTCCHDDLLDNTVVAFDERLDYVLVRDGRRTGTILGGVQATRTGLELWERVTGPDGLLWPSDHAGLVAQLRLPPTSH